ncbi:MAG: TIGR01440 family protein [Oscillospiraceae bacterium]|nr:TIGR01440 family protein [Oscillospiraceae bacterium]
MYQELKTAAETAARELIEVAKLEAGDIMVVGCSSSEVGGQKIGTDSNVDIADAVFSGIYGVLKEHGVYLAAQCCEHLNRALIVEKAAMRDYRLERVNVIPQKKAGGSFATAAYHAFAEPVAVEELHCAKAGMDIGDTLIGMHMAKVAVPVRLSVRKIGEANLVCARVRPKFVGGDRAVYDETLK